MRMRVGAVLTGAGRLKCRGLCRARVRIGFGEVWVVSVRAAQLSPWPASFGEALAAPPRVHDGFYEGLFLFVGGVSPISSSVLRYGEGVLGGGALHSSQKGCRLFDAVEGQFIQGIEGLFPCRLVEGGCWLVCCQFALLVRGFTGYGWV